MEILEGRQSVFAALRARQRKFQVILIRHGTHEESIRDITDLAGELSVPVRFAEGKELDAMAHGSTHGGVLAVASPKPRMSVAGLMELLDRVDGPPLLLLFEGGVDGRNFGFTIRSAEALGAPARSCSRNRCGRGLLLLPLPVRRERAGVRVLLPSKHKCTLSPALSLRTGRGSSAHRTARVAKSRATCNASLSLAGSFPPAWA